MSTYVKNIKNRSGDIIYPKTNTSAIYDGNDRNLHTVITNMETAIDEKITADDSELSSESSIVNADRLNGHGSDYFLNAGDIIDSLDSRSRTDALSANQGRVLMDAITVLRSLLDLKISNNASSFNNNLSINGNLIVSGNISVGSDGDVSGAKVRNIIISTEEPGSEDGNSGDIWLVCSQDEE